MIKDKIKNNVPLAPFTTFKIGGPAKYFLSAKSQDELVKAINWAKHKNFSYFILGGGSNILVSDMGFNGLVIKLDFGNIRNLPSRLHKTVNLLVGAGASFPRLVDYSIENDLTGLEWAIGIPGTVGGAIRGNAGAHGHSISEHISVVKVLRNKSVRELKNKEIKFSYRCSIFHQNKDIILQAILVLKKGIDSDIKKILRKNLRQRAVTQPYGHSPGCIFKNVDFSNIPEKVLKKNAEINRFKSQQQVPTGWLIDNCGLKGKKIGDAEISKKHANFIVNTGSAHAKDVIELIKFIKLVVKNKFGVNLSEEIQYIGF